MAQYASVHIRLNATRLRHTLRRSLIEMGIPLHRADVPVDSCAFYRVPHPCLKYVGRHRETETGCAS